MKANKRICFSIAMTILSCQNKSTIITPQVKPLMEGVYASGFVISENEYQVIAQVEGYLKEKLVNEGDAVKAGDVLFKIESDQQQSRNRLAQENYAIALKNYQEGSPVLQELKSAVEVSKAKLIYDSINLVRYSNLLKENATPKAEYDRIKLIYENSRNEYQLQKSRYEKVHNQVYLEYQNARSQQQIALSESGRYLVRSEVDGKVFKIMKEKGELVRRSEAIAIVGGANFYLQLSVDELDIQRVQVGQEVLIKIDAFPHKIYTGKVDKVYPMINQQQQSIRVDARFDEELPGGYSGLAVEANIVIRKKESAIVLPRSVVLNGDSLRIRTEDGIKKVKVVTGIKTLDEVEIMEGITVETEVVSN